MRIAAMGSAKSKRGGCCDIDDLARPLRRTGSDIHQLGCGPLSGKYDHVQLRGTRIHRIAVNRTVHAFNLSRSHFGFVPITAANEGTRFCGHQPKAGQICVNFPGDDWDFLISAEWLRIELPDDSLTDDDSERNAQKEFSEDATRIVNPKPAAFTQLLNRASQLLNRVPASEIANDGAEQELIVSLRDSLLSTDSGCHQQPRGALNHRRIVRQAHQYMFNHIDCPQAAEDVCCALDVSERTLRYAFHDAFELSPMAYFKRMRMNAAHSVLKSHDRCTITVHEVAERFGFEHVGAFAADYRKLFGNYPSETLAPVRRSPSGS